MEYKEKSAIKYHGEWYWIEKIEAPVVKVIKDFYEPHGLYKCVNGTATCLPEDTFDVEVGLKIALNKCSKRYYSKLADFHLKLSCKHHDAVINARVGLHKQLSQEQYLNKLTGKKSNKLIDIIDTGMILNILNKE